MSNKFVGYVDELEQVLVDDELEEFLTFTPKLTTVKNQLKTNEINNSNRDLRCELVDIKNNIAVIRCNLNTADDVEIFFDLFKEKSATNWIIQGQLKYPEKILHYVEKITLMIKHNHTINTSGSLKYLRIHSETEQTFMQYFNDGMGPNEAYRFHENQIMKNKSPLKLLANGSINPIKNTVYHVHNVWRNLNFGSIDAPLEKLKEKIDLYDSQGISVNILEEKSNWVVLVSTSIMKRAQMLSSSKELIFCDSSSSCDTLETTITILAVPIALLLHPGQSAESYKTAFGFLKLIYPKCFGNIDAPYVFMTDDSAAEKQALHEVWPTSKQLLCHFHVGQKEWRWLTDSKNQIVQDKRQSLMEFFKKVMYADNEKNLEEAVLDIKKLSNDFPKFVKRFEFFYKRRTQWVQLYRLNILTGGNNTNNYAEASIRVLKEIVLCRTKAYNVVALVESVSKVWEEYFTYLLIKLSFVYTFIL
ncbi:uncharacterized protein LOC132925167 [Rhopalosiphum padi]|uniref:uncharacterized protein LOC132925167 n=1 Tax=Rhopalosiphum padi TaxID=40932 RepID=UPI00298D6F02|nr:uncharacterized protein LOC132925167 [Rhopalosiphum padi]